MIKQVPFIDRENELVLIGKLIGEWGARRVLCIDAAGGIGKTRLLQEVRQRYIEGDDQTRLIVTDIVDFDDRTYRTPQNVGRRIAQMLDERIFEPYLQKLTDYRRMEMAGISRERLIQEDKVVTQAFADCFNEVTVRQRVVLLFDTLDVQEGAGIWNYILEFGLELDNVVLLIAGRNARGLWKSLQSRLGKDAQLVDLPRLKVEASELYLQQKQELLRVTLEPDIARKLLLLAGGRPILIDLAVEWRARGITLDWLVESGLEELESFSDDAMGKRQEEFEYQLVQHIADTRQAIDRLTLMMSRVFPLDVNMIVELLKIPKDEAEALFKDAQTCVFVKSLPGERISLHDEMRRMVNEHVWPNVDPNGDRQRRNSKLAAEYLERKIQTLSRRIEQLESEEQDARREKDAQAELKAFTTREDLERGQWSLREQLLFHTLFTDIKEGVRVFVQIFDDATRAYHFAFRKTLLELMQRRIGKLSAEQKYQVNIRQVKYLLDSGQYKEANKLLEGLSHRTNLQPAQEIDVLIQRANVGIRLGHLFDGIKFFERAIQLSKENELKEWLVKSETGLGWAYRLIHERKRAGEHYEIALDLAIDLDLKHQQALLYNNLGFVYAYFADIPGYRDKAVWFCRQSLAISEEINDRRGQGSSYSTLGCIAYMDVRYDEALSYFQKALNIFEPANDREWLSTVYSWRGAVYMCKNEFDLAEKDLRRSLQIEIRKDMPMSLSRLGRVYMHLGKLDKAQENMQKCYELALKVHDVLYQLVSLRFLARLAFLKNEYERLDEFEQLLADYQKKWGEIQDSRSLGLLHLNLGSLALCSNLDKAVDYFELGLKISIQLDRYGSDTPQAHIKRLEKVMVTDLHLLPVQIRDIGSRLLSFWREEGLNFTHPDIRILLARWANWEGR